MVFDLAKLARAVDRSELLKSGELLDASQVAAWKGFNAPAAVTLAAWTEVVGWPGAHATKEERATAASQLERLWGEAQRAVLAYRASRAVLNCVRFRVDNAAGKSVPLRLVCSAWRGATVVTIYLEGEA
jgi:hypothetical protein